MSGRPVIVMKSHNSLLVNPNLQMLELYTNKERKTERQTKKKRETERGKLAYNLLFMITHQ